jgi:hypothetical protein
LDDLDGVGIACGDLFARWRRGAVARLGEAGATSERASDSGGEGEAKALSPRPVTQKQGHGGAYVMTESV